MAWTERKTWARVKIGGLWVQSGPVRISESVTQLSRVAQFEIAEQPADEPDYGDAVLVEWIDFTDELAYDYFGGTISAFEVESQPWLMTVICNDQLRLLDRVRQGTDLDLTGMTPKEALSAVLTGCGCTYDAADLADPAYVLGEREPVMWHVDTPGSQITNELSTVFGCVLLTVANDRILWLSHDATPSDGTGSYGTFTRGTSIDFAGHHRSRGDRARIQNNWMVRGVTADLNDQCTATPWAKAVGTNPQLGRGRLGVQQVFQSDLIQSEDLAEEVVRGLMRETNKLPDERSTPMLNAVNIHPCSKIAIVDTTYGIGDNPTYFSVRGVEREGSLMTLALSAGPGGSEGTVTSGVDKVCTDVHTVIDWPGIGFDPPDFDFPPFDFGLDFGVSLPDFVFPDFDVPIDLGGLGALDGIGGGLSPDWGGAGELDVVAVPDGGSYALPQTVHLIPTYGPAFIYYTTDGSTPTTSSTNYSGSVSIAVTTTLKFFARVDAEHISPVRTEVYTIGEVGSGDPGCGVPLEDDWIEDSGSILDFILADGFAQNDMPGQVHSTTVSVTDADSWELRATMFAGDNNSCEIGLTSNGTDAPYYCLIYAPAEAGDPRIEIGSQDDNDIELTDLSGGAVDVVLFRDAVAQTLHATFNGSHDLEVTDIDFPVGEFFPYVRTYQVVPGGLGNAEVSDMELCTV